MGGCGRRGSRFREIGVKTGKGEHAREEEKYSRDRAEDKYRDRVAGYQGIDPGVERRRARDEEQLSKRPCLFTLGRAFR